jgi:hypothetical protein
MVAPKQPTEGVNTRREDVARWSPPHTADTNQTTGGTSRPCVDSRAFLTGILWALLAAPLLSIGLCVFILVQSSVSGALVIGAVVALAVDVGVAVLGYRRALGHDAASTMSLIILVIVVLAADGLLGWATQTDTVPATTPETVCNATAYPDAWVCPPVRNYKWVLASGALLTGVELGVAGYMLRRPKLRSVTR